jgi:hypothetical protein
MHFPSKLISMASAALLAGLMSAATTAQEPEPTTFVDVPAPQLTRWSSINALTVDPESPEGVTYIYPDEATRNLDTEGDGTGAIALIHWELDDASGRAPGIQAITDDFAFPTQNCIMASGERELEGELVPKTCSDPRGSSKRVFLEILEADTPIDIVFETGVRDIRYKGVQDPAVVGNDDALSEFRDTYGIGRIYRVIQKFINDTGERVAAVRVEVGTGVGADFQPLSFNDYGVAYELRPLVDREFFVGNTGAGDRAVWNENRYAHFSPKMFDTGERQRFDPGFLDDESAGLFPPQDFQTTVAEGTKTRYIDSGVAVNALGYYGATTPNYFDLPGTQGAGAAEPFTGTVFGYFLPDTLVPTVIERHDDGNAASESDGLEAWWDGYIWRYGRELNFAEVPLDQLQQWAAQLLGQDIPGLADTTRFATGPSDDFSGLNMDTYLYLGDRLLEEGATEYYRDGPPRLDSITVRYTAVSTAQFGTVDGTADPEWIANPAPTLASYMPETGVPVAINDSAITRRDESVAIDVLANDLLDGELVDPEDATILADNAASGTVIVEADQTVTYTPDLGFVGEDTFTYTVMVGGEESNVATVKVTVVAPPDPDVPVAVNDSATTTGTESVDIAILANDTVGPLNDPVDPSQATVTLGIQPSIGSVVINADNTVTYQADAVLTESMIDFFTYKVTVAGAESNSALVIVRVDAPFVAPIVPVAVNDTASTTGTTPVTIDILANDTYDAVEVPADAIVQVTSSPANGTVVVNVNHTVTFTADQGFDGVSTFTYRVSVAGEVSNIATVSVTVAPAPQTPPPTTPPAPPPPPPAAPSPSGGGGCTVGTSGGFDPLLPGLVLLALGFLGRRRLAAVRR